ncbi:MAG: hydrolase, partial [Clostridiaceae bacterium]|nr:hydrolase [Clostridiaceae bacterium]
MAEKFVPVVKGVLRSHMIEIPEIIEMASGIKINGKLFKSLAFTTDVAIIKNINADGIIAVYPFTPQPVITQAILECADVPVFVGVGGGITNGKRTVNLALHAEFQGAAGVVLNAPVSDELIKEVANIIDIPIIITVVSENCNFRGRLDAGAKIFNVSGAAKTPQIVRRIREEF